MSYIDACSGCRRLTAERDLAREQRDLANAEVARLATRNATLRGLMALDEMKVNPPPPMPSLSYYSDPSDVIAIVRDRGVHPTEADWLATFMEAWIPRG